MSTAALCAIVVKAIIRRSQRVWLKASVDEKDFLLTTATVLAVAMASAALVTLCYRMLMRRVRASKAGTGGPGKASSPSSPVTPHPSDLASDAPAASVSAPSSPEGRPPVYDETAGAEAVVEAKRAFEAVELCREAAATEASTSGGDVPHLHCLSFDLPDVSPKDAFAAFWADENGFAAAAEAEAEADGCAAPSSGDSPRNARSFYPWFLNARCKNTGACATAWAKDAKEGSSRRRVDTQHPLSTSIRMPGLALAIPTIKIQRVYEDESTLAVAEESCFDKIPYAAALRVETSVQRSSGGRES